MKLKAYFESKNGTGILATADKNGKVDAAIYSRPHVLEDGTIAFIMRDRLTRLNLQSNPNAVYLFIEQEAGYQGKRLFLKKIREEQDGILMEKMHRRILDPDEDAAKGPKFLVFFAVDRELPLVGAGD